jgi:hypothetical protein
LGVQPNTAQMFASIHNIASVKNRFNDPEEKGYKDINIRGAWPMG